MGVIALSIFYNTYKMLYSHTDLVPARGIPSIALAASFLVASVAFLHKGKSHTSLSSSHSFQPWAVHEIDYQGPGHLTPITPLAGSLTPCIGQDISLPCCAIYL